MTVVITQLITGMLGSLGFAMMFGLKKRYLLNAALGGLMCCGLYHLGLFLVDSIFISCLLASAFCAFYSEIIARVQKAPTTLFFITSVVALIPGSSLYYACLNAVTNDFSTAKKYAEVTLQYALAIAAGSCIVWAIILTVENVKKHNKKM